MANKIDHDGTFRRRLKAFTQAEHWTDGYNLKAIELMYCAGAINHCDGNFIEAAKLLGIGKTTLYRKVWEWKP